MKKQRGQAMVVVAILLFCILGMLALVIDTGRAYIDHSRLQRAVDSAVLAGVQELPSPDDTEAREVAREAFDVNMGRDNVSNAEAEGDLSYNMTTLRNPHTGDYDTMLLTADTIVYNQLAQFLGYTEWPIIAQAGAISGPVGKIQHWIPIGVEYGDIELYQHYRLSNEPHELTPNASGHARLYKPIARGNLRDGVANTIKQEITVGTRLSIANNANVIDICNGVDQRIRSKTGQKGCFNVDDAVPGGTGGENIIGPGLRREWSYGEDPRLVYVPFVKQVDNNTLEVVGFGLFYIEYSHYDSNALGAERPISELVGFFVRTIVEGPIVENGQNYGVIGIEYVDFLQSMNQ